VSVAIGIDLGTTNTVVAAVVDGVAVTLEDDQGRRLLPSVVSFHPSGTVLVGEAARERRLIDPENTIFSIKPLLGRPWDSDEVKAARTRFPFQFQEGAKNSAMVMARDVAYALPEISAFVLRRAKAIAEAALKQPVERAVITVPANFNDLQRASTKIAGKLAGLEVMRILNEPTAAALAYGQSIAKAEKIGVYDLGGGTFDVTLLDLTGNVFEVLATAGDTALGGDDIDRLLAERMSMEVVRRYNYDPRTNPVAFGRLRFIAEELKKELSARATVSREITGIGYTEGGVPITMKLDLTREELERITLPLVEKTLQVARQSIEIVGLSPKQFDRVILVGGSTRMPLVARMVEQLFGQPPHLKVNPDEVVALGAAIQAHALSRSKKISKRRSAHDQLAKAAEPRSGDGRLASQPPTHNPVPPAPPEVPKAPPLPAGMAAQGGPQVFELSKAPAVISFTPPPPPPGQLPQLGNAGRPGSPAAKPGKPPPIPRPGAARSDNAASSVAAAQEKARASLKPIEGKPVRVDLDDAVPGPKPPRTSGAPERPAPALTPLRVQNAGAYGSAAPPELTLDAPDLDFDPIGPGQAGAGDAAPAPPPPPPRPPSAPDLDVDAPARPPSDFGAVVAAPDFFPDPAQPIDAAAFQRGSAIETADSAPLLIDVTPLSLRVETVGGYSDVLIAANSPVPCEKTRTFLTASDNQTVVFIRVAQGESSRFAENTYLGECELSGLTAARRGEVRIGVTFELDVDGILNVRAKDQVTGRETMAAMKVLGAATDAAEVDAMVARQARHVVA
jgi:molecular chaperone DnaK